LPLTTSVGYQFGNRKLSDGIKYQSEESYLDIGLQDKNLIENFSLRLTQNF